MKEVIFDSKTWGYLQCQTCGQKITLPLCGNKAYEVRFLTCRNCKTTFNYYANPVGKIFSQKKNEVIYLGYTYKVL